MDSNYRANIAKWLPPPGPVLEKWFVDSVVLEETMGRLSRDIAAFLKATANGNSSNHDVLKEIITSLEMLISEYRMSCGAAETTHPIYKYRFEHFTGTLRKNVNILARFARKLIRQIIDCDTDEFLRLIFRLVNTYNDLVNLEHDVSDPSINIFYNDAPSMLEPLKRITVTRVLQILANNKAESYCHELIDCLLTNYRKSCDVEGSISADIEISENSSIEIYRALTKHLTPPIANTQTFKVDASNAESVQTLVDTQNSQVMRVLTAAMNLSPQLLGPDALSNDQDEVRLRKSTIKKVIEYYQEVVWGSVSSILDHVVLWWSPEALAARHSRGSQHLKDWLHNFIQDDNAPPSVRPALQTLYDALGCHVTITAWDQLFRLAYTSAFEAQSKSSSEVNEGTDTGQKFVELFQLLVTLSNECEMAGEWALGAPLIELPLSEQIVVLHRMDHSVHTVRLWALHETGLIADTWDLEVFFLIVKNDIVNCIEELSYLKLADHTNSLEEEPTSVQVYVCTKMRAKIVSEVKANIQLLKEAPTKCISILAKICRVYSLANIHMCFPKPGYWRKSSDVAPVAPSLYVATYFERVLLPVLEVTEDSDILNMILRLMCEAWLDYIYCHRIKFSEWGALQLLTDFAHVMTWVTDRTKVSENVRDHLLKNEVLRRCEGVGRLLLRHPGEAITMNKQAQRTNENGSPESLGLERMPAEMYVPNQEQWLELRASKRYNFCCTY